MQNYEYMVSVAIRAYNMEKFIEDCLNSVAMQDVPFNMEIVISTDCCADHTSDRIKAFKESHPDVVIRDVTPMKNLGAMESLFYVIDKCEGKYIALLDGDDYWQDKEKILKQVTFLEQTPEFSGCFHNMNIDGYSSARRIYGAKVEDREYNINEILENWVIPTSSFVFCEKYKDKFPLNKSGFYWDDIVVFLTIAQQGKIRGFKEKMAYYRQDENSWVMSMRRSKELYDRIDLHYRSIQVRFPQVSSSLIIKLRFKNQCFKLLYFMRSFLKI